MKTPSFLLSLFAALAALSSPLRADLVVVQHLDGPMSMDLTMKFKGNQMRMETGAMGITLINFDTGDTATIIPAQKMVMKQSGADIKKAMQAAATPGAPAPAFTATGKTEKVGGYSAEEYTINLQGVSAHYWFTKDYPNAAAFRDAMVKMMESSFAKVAQATTAAPLKFPEGVPVKTEIEMAGQKILTTLVSVKEEPVPASDFVVPADYKTMEMPKMPAGASQ